MQPEPAAVIAWRYVWSCTSPQANTPSTLVYVEPGCGDEVAVLVHVEHAGEQVGVGAVADRDEQAGDGQRRRLAGLDVAHDGALERSVADEVVDDGVPQELDLRVGEAPGPA